ncbi:MAG: tRNA lysidine(34) synthetase TilS [Gemmatimonadaceae bacterium]
MSSRAVPHAMPASAARALSRANGPLVLAISGGLDSMVLLHMAASRPSVTKRCCVATFDHRTGVHATRAARLVREVARAYGLPVVTGRAQRTGANEAQWREMRWRFLKAVAARHGAAVVTAHTRDDQLETVVMRILRGASARGLAALYADAAIVRPLLHARRRTLEQYARAHSLAFVEDPTNSSPRYLRNRVRRDLLPAFRAVQPTFDTDMLALAREAGRLRRRVEHFALRMSRQAGNAIEVDVASLDGLNREGIAILWPAFVARLGVALDRRGVERATDFAMRSRTGNRAQCSGGVRLERTRRTVVITLEVPSPETSSPKSGVRAGASGAYADGGGHGGSGTEIGPAVAEPLAPHSAYLPGGTQRG